VSTYSAANKTKQRIINAAGQLAAENGFDRVTTRAVAERSGENLGSIYYYFKTRQALLECVVETVLSDNPVPRLELENPADENSGPERVSELIRQIVHQHIIRLFCNDKPGWHSQLIYQLMEAEESLYSIFEKKVLDPDEKLMTRLLRKFHPDLTDEDAILHGWLIKTPLISHAVYRPIILKRLGQTAYSLNYLNKLEDLVVRQTQLLLGLPEDLPMIGD
jgi:AcrR family transcriptional regulator